MLILKLIDYINAQTELCKADTDFLLLTDIADELLSDLENVNPTAPGHYSNKGYERLGRAAARGIYEKYLCIKK